MQLCWQLVEQGLFEVFLKVATCRDEKIAAAIFYSINDFSRKLEMTRCAARLFLPNKSPLHDEWKKLHKALTEHSERRNALAHFRTSLHVTVGGGDAVVKLHPNYTNPNEKFKDEGRRKTKMAMTTKDILRAKNEFDALATKLKKFSATIPQGSLATNSE